MIVPILALMIPITAIIAFFVTVIAIAGMFRRKGSAAEALPEGMEQEMRAMTQALARMEDRLLTLERILDAEQPKWRTQL